MASLPPSPLPLSPSHQFVSRVSLPSEGRAEAREHVALLGGTDFVRGERGGRERLGSGGGGGGGGA
jgi:hypothetical protein